MLFAQTAALVILYAVITVFLCLFSIAVFVLCFAPWLVAYLSGVPIPLLRVLAMRRRRVDVGAVVRALVLARQAGLDVSCSDMEWAVLQGVDPEEATRAMLDMAQKQPGIAFRDVVRAEREARGAEKPGQ